MDQNSNNGGPGNQLGSFPEYQAPKKGSNKLKGLLSLAKKYWYFVLGVVIIFAVLSFLLIQHANDEAAWSRAQDYFGKADYEKAAKELDGMDAPSDSEPERLTVYSQTMLATRQLDNALTGYERLYETKKDPATKIIIGNIYNEKKQYDKSIETYRQIIDTDKTYVQAYVNLASLHRMQGDNDIAVEVAKKGVEANSSNVVLHELYVSMLLDKKESEEFRSAVEELRKLSPEDPLLQAINET